MATTSEKLAASLNELKRLQKDGSRVFQSNQLTRTTRERLTKNGFLQEVMKGWLISASPTALPGDTTPWFASFWEFCRRYCDDRFDGEWHLSPEQSLMLHAENTVIPKQLVINSPNANNNNITLPFETSLFGLKEKEMPPNLELTTSQGVRVFSVAAALARVPEAFFALHPVEAQVALGSIQEPSEILTKLLGGGHSVVAGRLAGAFRRLGKREIADEIVQTMNAADHRVRETDPFETSRTIVAAPRVDPPIVARLRTLWASTREAVITELPEPGAITRDHDAYLRQVDAVHALDAYHSLSIEGYRVTPELIDRVARGAWDPNGIAADRESQDALAARGYWLAFQSVRETLKQAMLLGNGASIVRSAHRDWYRQMFSPNVAVGLLDAAMLAGYRNQAVYLRGSRHVPPRWEVLRDAMPALFMLIEEEPHAGVRAVLGHWLFGYVHPFPDGNGRIARFLMNTLLVTGGYPWTVVRVEDRTEYLAGLESASGDGHIQPFARFITKQMRLAIEGLRAEQPQTD